MEDIKASIEEEEAPLKPPEYEPFPQEITLFKEIHIDKELLNKIKDYE